MHEMKTGDHECVPQSLLVSWEAASDYLTMNKENKKNKILTIKLAYKRIEQMNIWIQKLFMKINKLMNHYRKGTTFLHQFTSLHTIKTYTIIKTYILPAIVNLIM